MSIFKTKVCWSNETLREGTEDEGSHNSNCLIVNKFSSHSDSDCIIVSEGSKLKIYKPGFNENKVTDIVLEKELPSLILCVSTGKFVMNSDEQIIVLQTDSFCVYGLERKDGHNEAGEQNILTQLISHKLNKPAFYLVTGHFDNIKSRDLVCVQCLDGSLNFFDQDICIFTCVYTDMIMPGPIAYIDHCDSFVICKSTWIMEIYSYQQLRDFSESSIRQNKKQVPQWCYNAGEEITSLQVIRTSNIFSSIIALGERYMCCFQDNGLLKFIKKFDFMPTCFYAYLIGWYYEPGARLMIMVASEDCKLFIYEDTTLLWSCDLPCYSVAISRCFLKGLPGGVVLLSNDGIVSVGYMGTEPDLNGYSQATINEPATPEAVQAELETVEEALKNIMDNKDSDDITNLEDLVNINIVIGKPVQNLFNESEYFNDTTLHLLTAPILTKLTFEDPKSVQGLQITFVTDAPFICSETTVCMDSVNGTEIVETNILMSSEWDILHSEIKIVFTITNEIGKILVLTKTISIPINLYCNPIENDNINNYKLGIVLKSNSPCLDLMELFSEFEKEDLFKSATTATDICLSYRATKDRVTIHAHEKSYEINAHNYKDIIPILETLVNKLDIYLKKRGDKLEYAIEIEKNLFDDFIHIFLKNIEVHAKARIKLKKVEDQLNVLHSQFILIQKKLLVQYGSQPPGDCDALEFLMKDTYSRLQDTTKEIINDRESVCRAGNSLLAVGNLIIHILKVLIKDSFKLRLIEEMLALQSLYDDYQEWEEAVSQAIPYIIKNLFNKTEKDKEKLAPVTEQDILSHINLKRFIKQIRFILGEMFSEVAANSGPEQTKDNFQNTKVVRVEELIEVI